MNDQDFHLPAGASRNKSNKTSQFFENSPEFIRPERVAAELGFSIATIYDWRYRQKQKKVPANLFLKFNRILFLRTAVLREWIASQNPS